MKPKTQWHEGENEKQLREFLGFPLNYLILTMNTEGHIHIHGPFDSHILMQQFARALINEMEKKNIKFELNVETKKGD